MNEISKTSLGTLHTLNLKDGYLRDRTTGEFISRQKIDSFLSRSGNIKSIEIVCHRNYKPDKKNLYTRKVLHYLAENLLDINELVLVDANQRIINELGIADKHTRIKRLQIKGENEIRQNIGSQMPELAQLICFEEDLYMFEENRNIHQLFITECELRNDNSFAMTINGFLERNKDLNELSIQYIEGSTADLVAKVEEFDGVPSLLKRMNYFKIHFSNELPNKPHTFGFNKTRNLVQTTAIDLVKDIDFGTSLNLRVVGIDSVEQFIALQRSMGDKLYMAESLYADVAPTVVSKFWRMSETTVIPMLECHCLSTERSAYTDKFIIQSQKKSLKVFAHSELANEYIKGDLKSLEISYYNTPTKANDCAQKILALKKLNELIVNKSNTLFKEIILGYEPGVHFLQLQTLKLCKEAAKELSTEMFYNYNKFLSNSALKTTHISNGVPSKAHRQCVPIDQVLSEISFLTGRQRQGWHFEINAERPDNILGMREKTT